MSSNGEDIIRETFEKLGDATGIQIDIPDETIADLAATLQTDIDRIDNLTTELGKAMMVSALERTEAWEECSSSRYRFLAYARDALAHLQSADRLLAADEMRLTAEQVEDVRAAREELRGYRNFTGYGRSHVNQLIAAVDALFPATEPAAVRDGSDLVVVQRSHTAKAVQSWMTLDLWTDLGKNDKDFDAEYERQGFGDLWAILLGEVRALVQATTPAPATPAEHWRHHE